MGNDNEIGNDLTRQLLLNHYLHERLNLQGQRQNNTTRTLVPVRTNRTNRRRVPRRGNRLRTLHINPNDNYEPNNQNVENNDETPRRSRRLKKRKRVDYNVEDSPVKKRRKKKIGSIESNIISIFNENNENLSVADVTEKYNNNNGFNNSVNKQKVAGVLSRLYKSKKLTRRKEYRKISKTTKREVYHYQLKGKLNGEEEDDKVDEERRKKLENLVENDNEYLKTIGIINLNRDLKFQKITCDIVL